MIIHNRRTMNDSKVNTHSLSHISHSLTHSLIEIPLTTPSNLQSLSCSIVHNLFALYCFALLSYYLSRGRHFLHTLLDSFAFTQASLSTIRLLLGILAPLTRNGLCHGRRPEHRSRRHGQSGSQTSQPSAADQRLARRNKAVCSAHICFPFHPNRHDPVCSRSCCL